MCGERHGQELLDHFADRRAIGPHPPFFNHDIPFFVELAKDWMRKSRRLQISPQLQAVHGKREVILGVVVASRSIHVFAALALHDFAELIGNYILLSVFDCVLP